MIESINVDEKYKITPEKYYDRSVVSKINLLKENQYGLAAMISYGSDNCGSWMILSHILEGSDDLGYFHYLNFTDFNKKIINPVLFYSKNEAEKFLFSYDLRSLVYKHYEPFMDKIPNLCSAKILSFGISSLYTIEKNSNGEFISVTEKFDGYKILSEDVFIHHPFLG